MHEGQNGSGEGAARVTAAQREPGDPVTALEERLGLALADRAAGLAALTHKSYVNEHREDGLQDNERLEFLGDAVIDLAVSHRLMQRFPAAREGDLSKMRAAVVDEQGLADMARALDLGSLLRLGRGEELTGGRAKSSLLADAMEAVIAAVYQGQGLGAVLEVVDRFLGEAFARAIAGTLDRDFKTQLQELAQSRMRVAPRYRVIAEHGPDHSKVFEVEVDLRGEVLGRGRGRSKKDAEQAAARLALEALTPRLTEPCAPAAAQPAAPVQAPTLAVEATAVAPVQATAEQVTVAQERQESAQREEATQAGRAHEVGRQEGEPGERQPADVEAVSPVTGPAAAPMTEPEAAPAAPAVERPRRRGPARKRAATGPSAGKRKPARTPKKPAPRGAKGSARPARKGTRARR